MQPGTRLYRVETANQWLELSAFLLGTMACLLACKLLAGHFAFRPGKGPLPGVVGTVGLVLWGWLLARLLAVRRYRVYWQNDQLYIQRSSWWQTAGPAQRVDRAEVHSARLRHTRHDQTLRLLLADRREVRLRNSYPVCRTADFDALVEATRAWLAPMPLELYSKEANC